MRRVARFLVGTDFIESVDISRIIETPAFVNGFCKVVFTNVSKRNGLLSICDVR